MKNKHLTKEMRERIEKGIRNGESLKFIAVAIDKDPTTISKEVFKHRVDCVPEGQFISPPLCTKCSKYQNCKFIKLCDLQGCNKECRFCTRVNVTQKCKEFKKAKCKRTSRFPYVCNGCQIRKRCRLQKYEYDPLYAERSYRNTLKESRMGLNLTVDEFKNIDSILKDGTDKGQSINHIVSTNPSLNISIKTAYNYVNSGNFQVKHNDLPNYANHVLKKRVCIPKEYEYKENKDMNRKGREYYDYILYIDENNTIYHCELDCVGITKDYIGALLTVIIPKWSFLLLYKLDVKDAKHVKERIDFIYSCLGKDKFKKYCGVLLTDRGPEFNNYNSIEADDDGLVRCKVFYCDSGVSTQKPYVERINREIRRYIFKGQSVEKITQSDCDIIASNINSMALDSLGERTPYEFAKTYLGVETLNKLNISYIEPKNVIVKNIDLIRHENKKKSK